jgi:hypothetical protein
VSVAALAISAAVPAFAASSPGWRRVDTVHFGAAGTPSEFAAIAPLSSSLAWAGGGLGDGGGVPRAYRWTGSAWKASALPTGLQGPIERISAQSGTDIWAIGGNTQGTSGGYIVHYNGSKWSTSKRFAGFGELTGVTAFGPSNVWVFGGPGASPGFGTWQYNGTTWTEAATATSLGIVSASAVSPANMWAIGSVMVGGDSIFHYTGTWTQAKASALSGLEFGDILAKSATNVWATAHGGTKAYLVHRTPSGWTRIAVPWPVNLTGITTDGQGGFWLTAFGSSGAALVLHRSAAGNWTRTSLAQSGFASGIARIPGTTSLWATGDVNTSSGSNAVIWADGRV